MLASRVLPPILWSPHPPPIATFFNIPRRYVKSNMNVGDNASYSPIDPMEGVKSPRTLRKSSRIHDTRSASACGLVPRSKEEVLSSSAASSPRASRKRIALFDDAVNGGSVDGGCLEIQPRKNSGELSASSTGSGELSGHVCLCQPEPKIPRPRNAFILYRQHHQHAIVSCNPGLANPEISKIIGEQWKAEGDIEKKVWQDLAQEEKARHHEQYPDYRYQPRRLGKPGSLPLNPSGQHTTVEKYRCPRCGGRSIKTPTSPFISAGTPTLPPPNISEGLTPTTRYLPMMSNLSLESPVARRRGPGPSSLSNIQAPTSAREDAMYSPLSPDSKRRRYNYQPPNNGRRAEGPYYGQGHGRRDSLPPIQLRRSPPHTGTMPPPRTPRESRKGSVDLNLLVPNQHDQSRSVEAMVMSVPYSVKVKVLGRITPPLKDPGPTSPAIQIRGAIIAVEGEELDAIKELAEWLNGHLSKDKDCHPRITDPPRGPDEDQKEVSFEEYLDLIKEWHGKSREMVKFITTPVSVASSDADSDVSNDEKDGMDEKNAPPASPSLSIKPVAILPTYQLRASDAYTSRIPIQDAYSPTDHWQWMATLWRGTVGPDLTIYVKSYDAKEGLGHAKIVELNDENRCLTVHKEKEGCFDVAALRRVGFEVLEWIRSLDGPAKAA